MCGLPPPTHTQHHHHPTQPTQSGPACLAPQGEEEPNDTYIEQLTDCARAAVEELQRRGVSDPARIAVGGHSYGEGGEGARWA